MTLSLWAIATVWLWAPALLMAVGAVCELVASLRRGRQEWRR